METQTGGFAYLVKLSPEDNKNRFYRMIQKGDCFQIEMGRIGAQPVILKRPMSLWKTTLDRKLSEGYIDRSQYVAVETKDDSKYAPIQDYEVSALINSLMRYANIALEASYTVTYKDVSDQMIRTSQKLIGEISSASELQKVNRLLTELFVVIPRRMKDVREMLATDMTEVSQIIQREQNLLDVMAAKVVQERNSRKDKDNRKTILDAWEIAVRPCTDSENAQIIRHLTSESAPYFKRAFRIMNKKTDSRFYRYMEEHGMSEKNIHYYYHGSPNMNYIGLITEGQKLNPDAPVTGKMFGHGLYYAPRARKSFGYTSLNWTGKQWHQGMASYQQAFLAVYKVCYKNPLHCTSWDYGCCSYDAGVIKPHDAVFAHADGGASLYNDEVIVYREAQATIQYLIELEAKGR